MPSAKNLSNFRTIPWDKVDIEVISIEVDLAGKLMPDSSPEMIYELLENAGYTRFRHRKSFQELDQFQVRRGSL